MKRPAIVVAVLIVLVSLIGLERIGQGLRFLVSDDRAVGARVDRERFSSKVTPTKTSSPEDSVSSSITSRSDHRNSADAIVTPSTEEHNDARSVAVRITGEVSPMHFIRASSIIGSSEPSKEQIDRLREALAVIGDALRPGAVIFDADGFSSSQAPVIVFARDEFDLTDQVKAAYDALEKASNHGPQANAPTSINP